MRNSSTAIFSGVFFSALLIFGIFFRDQMFVLVARVTPPFFEAEESFALQVGFPLSMKNEGSFILPEKQSEKLRVAEIKLEMLRSENVRLKTILERKGDRHLLLASVIRKPPATLYDTFLLDVGGENGVRVGVPVFMYGNIVIGEIEDVSSQVSKVKLYSSPGSKIPVLLGEEKIEGVTTGVGVGNFKITLPHGILVQDEAKVSLPGVSSALLGIVEYVEKNEKETFQTVYVKSPVDIFSLQFVEVEI